MSDILDLGEKIKFKTKLTSLKVSMGTILLDTIICIH